MSVDGAYQSKFVNLMLTKEKGTVKLHVYIHIRPSVFIYRSLENFRLNLKKFRVKNFRG